MTTINKSIWINGDMAAIDKVIDDNMRLPEWYAGVIASDPDPGYPAEVGTTNRIKYKSAGITFDVVLTSLTYEPQGDRSFELSGMIGGINHWSFQSEGSGIRVTLKFEYEMPGGGLGKIADRLLVERTNEKNAETSLNKLKELVEADN